MPRRNKRPAQLQNPDSTFTHKASDKLNRTDEPEKPATMNELHKIKLPRWYPNKPELWFTMNEPHMEVGGLDSSKVADQKKVFTLVLSEIPENVAITVKSQIKCPHAGSEYNDLKDAILKKHQESPEEAFVWVMEAKLGDQKPSALAEQILAKVPVCNSDATDGCVIGGWFF